MNVDQSLSLWNEFKDSFPHVEPPFSKRNWGNELHSLCSFQGKMKPSLAHHLVGVFTEPGDIVFDPFAGSGTIPFEAALSGRQALASDISVMAIALSQAKLRLSSRERATELISELEGHIQTRPASANSLQDAADVAFNKSIRDYFHPDTFEEILRARDFFLESRDLGSAEWCLVFSSMLHILHGNRPYALSRRSHPITPYAPSGEFVYKSLIKHLRDKVERSLAVGRGFSFQEGECIPGDVLQSWDPKVRNVDCIITSPPFASSTRFYMTNWMRFWFAGWGRKEFDSETKHYLEVKQKVSMEPYDQIFAACSKRVRKGGLIVFHLGTNEKTNMAELLFDRAKRHLTVLDMFTETVEHCERHGIRDKGATVGHQYLVLQN